MNLGYAEIFGQRGSQYHRAMQQFPLARRREFAALFDRHPVAAHATVLDIPAGGGYLDAALTQARIIPLELASGFSDRIPVVAPMAVWPVPPVDHAVCLASLHHVESQASFLGNVCRHLKPDGVLHLADVAADSPIARFLDSFVGRWNGQGHHGLYLDQEQPSWRGLGRITRCEVVSCPWHFDSMESLLRFCTGLFDLQHCPSELLSETLQRDIGVRASSDGVELQWSLLYVDIQRTGAH